LSQVKADPARAGYCCGTAGSHIIDGAADMKWSCLVGVLAAAIVGGSASAAVIDITQPAHVVDPVITYGTINPNTFYISGIVDFPDLILTEHAHQKPLDSWDVTLNFDDPIFVVTDPARWPSGWGTPHSLSGDFVPFWIVNNPVWRLTGDGIEITGLDVDVFHKSPGVSTDVSVDLAKSSTRFLSITNVPEPDQWVLLVGGLGIAGGFLRRRRGSTLAKVQLSGG
jgi:hypothetical protein